MSPFVALGLFILVALIVLGTEMERRFSKLDAAINALTDQLGKSQSRSTWR